MDVERIATHIHERATEAIWTADQISEAVVDALRYNITDDPFDSWEHKRLIREELEAAVEEMEIEVRAEIAAEHQARDARIARGCLKPMLHALGWNAADCNELVNAITDEQLVTLADHIRNISLQETHA